MVDTVNEKVNIDEMINGVLGKGVLGKGARPSVFTSRLQLRPATGWDHPVIRAAVYSDGSKTYNERTSSPGPVISKIVRGDREIRVAIVESVEARAHDLTTALRDALKDAGVGVPTIELYANYDSVKDQYDNLLVDSWTAPHRAADPFWREALKPDPKEPKTSWRRFYNSEDGAGLNPAYGFKNLELLRMYPTSLLLGVDPRAAILSAKEGKQARQSKRGGKESNSEAVNEVNVSNSKKYQRPTAPFGRLCRSEIVAEINGLYQRTTSLLRPQKAIVDTPIFETEDGDWTLDKNEAVKDKDGKPKLYSTGQGKEAGRPSVIGLDDVTPSIRGIPDIYASKIILSSYLSLAGIIALHFESPESRELAEKELQERDAVGHALLVAMGVAAILGAEKYLRVRSDCDLVLDDAEEPIVRSVAFVDRKPQFIDANYDQAVKVLQEVAKHAKELGLWQPKTIRLVANDKSSRLVGLDLSNQ